MICYHVAGDTYRRETHRQECPECKNSTLLVWRFYRDEDFAELTATSAICARCGFRFSLDQDGKPVDTIVLEKPSLKISVDEDFTRQIV